LCTHACLVQGQLELWLGKGWKGAGEALEELWLSCCFSSSTVLAAIPGNPRVNT